MGFEDDFDFNDSFETDIADPDSMGEGDQPKRLTRKELREAKKKNAEKTADLPKQKTGLFSRHTRVDDDDKSLTEEHMFDPARTTMVSGTRDRSSRERENAPIRSKDSEFSYLFDPVEEGEGEDYVYPDQSIYSDAGTARDLLAGLSYDETRDGDSEEFDRYFSEHSQPVESKFTFKRKKPAKEEEKPAPEESVSDPEPPKPAAPVKVTPRKQEPPEEAASFLPELRPDSVFTRRQEPEPQPQPQPAPEPVRRDPPLPPVREPFHERSRRDDDRNDRFDDDDLFEDDFTVNSDRDRQNRDYMPPYSGMYPAYPMQPMNQMMSYPVIIPNAGQNQNSNMPVQTIPIPYPMPMPMPMPMYGQYPQYPPQYPQYPPQYPPYAPQDYYGGRPPYEDRRNDGDNRDSRDRNYDDRRRRRFNGRRRDDRRDHRDRYGDRYDDRYDDGSYDERYDSLYEDRDYGRDRRFDDRADASYYGRENGRGAVPRPPYEPPYPEARNDAPLPQAPIQAPAPVVQPAPISQPEPVYQPVSVVQPAPIAQPEPVYQPVSAVPPAPIAQEELIRQPEPEQVNTIITPDPTPAPAQASPEPEQPVYTPSPFAKVNFSFHKHNKAEEPAPSGNNGFGDNDFGENDFGGSDFSDGGMGGGFSDSGTEEEDDFGLGFGNRSISSDRPPVSEAGDKPSGGRFKKRK